MKALTRIFTVLYILSPLIVIPLVANEKGTTFVVLGIFFAYAGTFFALTGYDIAVYLGSACALYFWITTPFGIFDFTTFFFLCLTTGYLLTKASMRFRKLSSTSVID
jgi:hypothetical protein